MYTTFNSLKKSKESGGDSKFKNWHSPLSMLTCKTRVRDKTYSASTWHGKVMGSMLGRGTVVLEPNARCTALILQAQPQCLFLGYKQEI